MRQTPKLFKCANPRLEKVYKRTLQKLWILRCYQKPREILRTRIIQVLFYIFANFDAANLLSLRDKVKDKLTGMIFNSSVVNQQVSNFG